MPSIMRYIIAARDTCICGRSASSRRRSGSVTDDRLENGCLTPHSFGGGQPVTNPFYRIGGVRCLSFQATHYLKSYFGQDSFLAPLISLRRVRSLRFEASH